MFGYVLIHEKSLTPEAAARYQAEYCGLCRRLGALHGLRGRFVLSYDLTFLALLLDSLYEDEVGLDAPAAGRDRCLVHPLRPRPWRTGPATDYCADLSVALHYYSARDKWQDDRSPAARALMAALAGRLPGIEARWPRQCAAIQRELAALADLEADNCQQPDLPAACFGRLMAELFDWRQDRWSGALRAMGMALGQYIYLLDAAADLEGDRKKHHYNPLYAYSEAAGWQPALRQALEATMARCTAAFRVLPCVADADLLENILYAGVWLRWPYPQQAPGPCAPGAAQGEGEAPAAESTAAAGGAKDAPAADSAAQGEGEAPSAGAEPAAAPAAEGAADAKNAPAAAQKPQNGR